MITAEGAGRSGPPGRGGGGCGRVGGGPRPPRPPPPPPPRRTDPHPVTGQEFTSPVRPGTGWPGDPATAGTPRAATAAEVEQLALGARTVATLDARVSVCRACPRLVGWREDVAVHGRRASFADQPYWGRPGPGFGD